MPTAPRDVWIAVPTYWTRPSGAPGRERTVFDHPTPLDEQGTLGRTLDSFRHLDGDFRVLVVAAGAHPDLAGATRERVAELVAPFADDLSLYLVGGADVDRINILLPEPILSLDSYGGIRNVQLAVPFAMGSDVVAGIDDDEVIEDAGYIDKVTRYIGAEFRGATVGGMAGPYYDREGEYQLPGADALAGEENLFLKKNHFMNEALKRVMEPDCPDGIVRSNVAFGGNMCMSRETIAEVCHDPYIPRGEDYDYVLNAAMRGINFYFQPGMAIVHLPPDSTGPQAADKASKLIADIRRFIYMQEKVRRHREHYPGEQLDMAYFEPYPGPYLDGDADLAGEAVRALDKKYPELRQDQSPEALVTDAVETARRKAVEFFEYREKWQQTMAAIADRSELRPVIEALRIT